MLQMTKSRKNFIYKIVLFLFLFATLFPYCGKNINNFILISIWALLFLCIYYEYNFKLKELAIVTFVWLIYCVFEYIRVSQETAIGNLFNTIMIYSLFIISPLLITDKKMCKFLIFCCVAIQTIVALENIILLKEDPSLSKMLTAGKDSIMEKYKTTNLGSISCVFNSVVISIIGGYLFGYMSSKIYKIMITIVLMINVYYVFLAGSFVNLLCLGIGLILFLFVKIFKQKESKIIAVIVFLIISISLIFLLKDVVYFLLSIVAEDSYYFERLSEIYIGLSNGWSENFISYRVSLYFNSLLTFVENPIIGYGLLYTNNYTKIGMHSEICDFMGRFGILGLCLILSMLILLVKEIKKEGLNTKRFSPILISCFMNLLLNPLAGPSTGIILLMVVPAFITLNSK